MAWTVKASVKSVAGKERHGGASPPVGRPLEAAGGRVLLLVEMEAGFVGTVDISTDMSVQDMRVEVHLSNGGEDRADGEGES